jgi:hypothetical protein
MKRTLITLTIVVLFASAFAFGLAFRPGQSSSRSGLAPIARAQAQDDPFERARTRRCAALAPPDRLINRKLTSRSSESYTLPPTRRRYGLQPERVKNGVDD